MAGGLGFIRGGPLWRGALAAGARTAVPVPFSLSNFGVALIACLLAYDGWVQVSFVAGEIKRPQRNILLALALGVAGCFAIYTTGPTPCLVGLFFSPVFAAAHVGGLQCHAILGA